MDWIAPKVGSARMLSAKAEWKSAGQECTAPPPDAATWVQQLIGVKVQQPVHPVGGSQQQPLFHAEPGRGGGGTGTVQKVDVAPLTAPLSPLLDHQLEVAGLPAPLPAGCRGGGTLVKPEFGGGGGGCKGRVDVN